jgi:hypothetical protein
VTTTSTRPELEQTSFLSLLDMDPALTAQAALLASASPLSGRAATAGQGDALRMAVGSPPPAGSPVGAETPPRDGTQGKVFSDFRRLMNFAVRRETAG